MATTDTTARGRQPLEAGQAALARMEWEEARQCFQEAVREHETAEALEGLGQAAWWLDDDEEMFRCRERAYSLYRAAGDAAGAARLATLIGIAYYEFRGEPAIGNGWLRRAHNLLADLPVVPERGWLATWEGQISLIVGNDPASARRLGAQAADVGRALGIPDLQFTGLGLEGLALVTEGQVGPGMSRLDEATAAAVGGEMDDVIAIGATCCYLIYACERVRDFDRARQWCQRVQDLCRQAQWQSLFATCRTHHAAVLLWQGDWADAEAELEAATRELEASRPGKVAEGIVRLAELRRLQGRLEDAERLLDSVRFHPQALLPLANIAVDRGRPIDAVDLVQRFLRQIPDGNLTDRATAYEVAVRAHAVLGDVDDARAALGSMQALADAVGTDPLLAAVARAAGMVAAAEGDLAEARRRLEDAVDLFERTAAPFEAALARLHLARVLAELGRGDVAVDEARRAHDTFASMDAAVEARNARALLRELRAPPPRWGKGEESFGLSARELEVLGLVAEGLSNQQIAESLVLSEHTVRRHVANILAKMDVPSRAAAAALAARHGIL